MRSLADPNEDAKTALFVRDVIGGGCVVDACCEKEVSPRPKGGDHYSRPHICKCGREVFYPGWCDW
jgi:hypothetical protein